LIEPKSLVNCLSSLSLQQKEQLPNNSNQQQQQQQQSQQQLKSRSRSVPQFSSLNVPQENMNSIKSYMNDMDNESVGVSNEKIEENERAQGEEESTTETLTITAGEEPKVEFYNRNNEIDELKQNESDSFKSSMIANNTNNSLVANVTPPTSPNEINLNDELVNASTTAQASDSLTQNITDDEKIQSNRSNNQFG
jgi:hypothetical protein